MEHPNDPVARMPASTVFGFRYLERDAARAQVALPLKPEFLQGERRVHGGIVATLADTAAVYLLIQDVPFERTLTSIEFKLNFTRPAMLERGELVATAEVVKKGRNVALADVDVTQNGSLVAKGLFTYLFGDR